MTARSELPGVVLDTNVVLDWLVFRDHRAQSIGQAIADAAVRWWTCAPMRAELAHMLGSDRLHRWSPDAGTVLAVHDRLAVDRPPPHDLPARRPRCSDPDDQVFLDLALAQRARWLVTHDRALLRMARRVARDGLTVLQPQRWALDPTGKADPGP